MDRVTRVINSYSFNRILIAKLDSIIISKQILIGIILLDRNPESSKLTQKL